MKLADGIRKHGFRKWYERELLQSHVHLLLTFLCMIGVFAAVEAIRDSTDRADRLFDLAAIIVCALVGVWALRRYLYFLNHAESSANQADCPQCETYGRFKLEAEDTHEGSMRVCCNKCSHQWTIFD